MTLEVHETWTVTNADGTGFAAVIINEPSYTTSSTTDIKLSTTNTGGYNYYILYGKNNDLSRMATFNNL